MDPTNKPVEIKLSDGSVHKLVFDLNTFYEFEEKAGKTLPSFLLEMESAFAPILEATKKKKNLKPGGKLEIPPIDLTKTLGKFSIKDIRALIWSALHTYDTQGEPQWPYTIGRLGSLIDHNNLTTILSELIGGISNSLPEAEKEPGKAKDPTQGPFLAPSNGGSESGPSDEEVLASARKSSAS
jgi:hypothetical protein